MSEGRQAARGHGSDYPFRMLLAFNKPFGVLCQFTGEGPTLADYAALVRLR